jgi:heptosyltransferase-2
VKIAMGDKPRILITRADRIGDLILSTAVFPEIRKKFPKAYLACVTFLEHREILEGNPYLDEVILYDKKGREKSWLGQFWFAQKLAAKKFDIVIHLHATNRMHAAGWLARIPVRLGWDRRAAWALTLSYPEVKKEGKKHEAEYNFDLLEALGIKTPAKPQLYFPVTERSQASLDMLVQHSGLPQDKPWVVLAPGASCPSKIWPAARFGYFANAWNEKTPAVFIGVGGAQDRILMERVCETLSPQVSFYDWSGKLSLGMLAALLKRSSLMISNDSGPAHVGAAVGTPVLSIFGRNQSGLSPKRWRPLGDKTSYLWKDVGCSPCLAHECQINFLCLDTIAADEAVKEAEKIAEPVLTPAR